MNNIADRLHCFVKKQWIMAQTWEHVLFAHWQVSKTQLTPLLPAGLSLDLYQGTAWVSVLPFYLSTLRPRFLPPFPGAKAFPELNVRTYVIHEGRPGIYFFSLDASHFLAVQMARTFFHLPYVHATMTFTEQQESIQFWSRRNTESQAECTASYFPISQPKPVAPGSLAHWLVERYRLYTSSSKHLYYQDIDHEPWQLQKTAANVKANEVALAANIDLPVQEPLFHYARKQDVRFYPMGKCQTKRELPK
ncbi:YqjF family protein [Shouchella rhizosphaerae]|uniref:YqjF family protein n=1 Tax=Shouchella rhizosphaerae TaxID=866786 RepID=UPI003F7EFE51